MSVCLSEDDLRGKMHSKGEPKPKDPDSWPRLLLQQGPAWITAITGVVVALGLGVGVGYGASKIQHSGPAPTVTVTVTQSSKPMSPSQPATSTATNPGPEQVGEVRNLSIPLLGQGDYMAIDFDSGHIIVHGGGDPAYYQLASNTNIPELKFYTPFSLDVDASNASQAHCSNVINSNPDVDPITTLTEGRLICVQGGNGIAFLKIMKTVTSGSTTLYLRETYWPNQA